MAVKDITDLQVCLAVSKYKRQIQSSKLFQSVPYPYQTLAVETGECEKVCYRAMERAYRHGLIEFGVSLRNGWLTPEGMAMLQERAIA